MLPVWLLSPMVIVPVDVVEIRASSALVRLMPATALLLVPPMIIGRDSTDDWTVTAAVAGRAACELAHRGAVVLAT